MLSTTATSATTNSISNYSNKITLSDSNPTTAANIHSTFNSNSLNVNTTTAIINTTPATVNANASNANEEDQEDINSSLMPPPMNVIKPEQTEQVNINLKANKSSTIYFSF